MGRIVWRFILFLLPVLMIIGLFRVMLHPEQGFLPTADVLLRIFSSTPDFQTFIAAALGTFQETTEAWQNIDVVDLPSFFNAVGAFFTMIGNAIGLAFQVIRFPFEVLIYVFTNVLGLGSVT